MRAADAQTYAKCRRRMQQPKVRRESSVNPARSADLAGYGRKSTAKRQLSTAQAESAGFGVRLIGLQIAEASAT
jgi:hypothetical protein